MKRMGWTWVLILAFVVVAAACNVPAGQQGTGAVGPSSTPEATNSNGTQGETEVTQPKEKLTLKFYTLSGADKSIVDASIDEWHKLNPHIDVEAVVLTGEDSMDKLKVILSGGEDIDLVYYDFTNSSLDKASSIYYPLDELMQKHGINYLETYGEFGKATVIDGKTYGIGTWYEPSVMWINTKMLEERSIPLPDETSWTMDEYFALIAELTAKSEGNFIYGGMHWKGGVEGILDIAAYGNWEVVNEDGSPNIYSPVLRKAAQYFYDAMFVHRSIPTEAEAKANNQIAIYEFVGDKIPTMMGAGNTSLFMDNYKQLGHLKEEIDEQNALKMLYMPKWDKDSIPKRQTTNVISYAVAKHSKHHEEAFEYLKFFTQQGFVLGSQVSHRIPTWVGADINTLKENWRYFMKDGNLVQGKNRDSLYEKALDRTIIPIMKRYTNEYSYSSLMLQELRKELDLLLADEKTIDEALNTAHKASVEIYNNNR